MKKIVPCLKLWPKYAIDPKRIKDINNVYWNVGK